MNRKLSRFAKKAQLLGVLLLLLAALRADGGLGFWLVPALAGMILGGFGLGLAWLCGSSGLALRRRLAAPPVPRSVPCPQRPPSFPFPVRAEAPLFL